RSSRQRHGAYPHLDRPFHLPRPDRRREHPHRSALGRSRQPVKFTGPRRLVAPGMCFEDLPAIDAVIISPDHYDHLDEATVRRLNATHHPTFFVPLGIKAWLAKVGITNVVELDWWETGSSAASRSSLRLPNTRPVAASSIRI